MKWHDREIVLVWITIGMINYSISIKLARIHRNRDNDHLLATRYVLEAKKSYLNDFENGKE